ncbi:MAG: DUF5056 domain-containing protein [Verrucomicrobiaceae bacterium]|nr:DUF5056 domain-containing protein [Verrucomicrobiaceae bacterium]
MPEWPLPRRRYIDDAGFTARVVQQLPERRRASRNLRAAILLAATFIASVLAFVFAGPSLAAAATFLFALPPALLWVLFGVAGLVGMVLGGSFALSTARDLR